MNATEISEGNHHDPNAHLRPPRQSTLARSRSITSSIARIREDISSSKKSNYKWRHMLGIILLLATVFLWTASNFLASTIFADDTYSKPYFVTYTNSAFFVIPLPPILLWIAIKDPAQFVELRNLFRRPVQQYSLLPDGEDSDSSTKPDEPSNDWMSRSGSPSNPVGVDGTVTFAQNFGGSITKEKFTLVETAKLSFLFCFLWFPANYFTAACLEYTTVASATILAATSSIWTLLIGTLFAVERFTIRKLVGVLASLAGIILISSVDVSGETDKNRGSFPHKTPGEIAIGDILAFISAVVYGMYAVMIKKRIGDERRVNMPLFFGLVGLMTVLLLWPVFIILHITGIETFELPPDRRVTMIILLNSTTSLVSDFCWAYAMLYTSPLLVTVGLSLTIPLSLIGQMVLDHQYSSALYWIGACVVLLSFIFINHEESKEEEATQVEPGHGDDASFGGTFVLAAGLKDATLLKQIGVEIEEPTQLLALKFASMTGVGFRRSGAVYNPAQHVGVEQHYCQQPKDPNLRVIDIVMTKESDPQPKRARFVRNIWAFATTMTELRSSSKRVFEWESLCEVGSFPRVC